MVHDHVGRRAGGTDRGQQRTEIARRPAAVAAETAGKEADEAGFEGLDMVFREKRRQVRILAQTVAQKMDGPVDRELAADLVEQGFVVRCRLGRFGGLVRLRRFVRVGFLHGDLTAPCRGVARMFS